ncbi:hypothetical protein CLOP_g227 [Closterium sp. NIES-67]|nr:hypothetical protein CLOP_g227 [Closterium sp. NIES-67]
MDIGRVDCRQRRSWSSGVCGCFRLQAVRAAARRCLPHAVQSWGGSVPGGVVRSSFRAGCMAKANSRGPRGSPCRTPRSLLREGVP